MAATKQEVYPVFGHQVKLGPDGIMMRCSCGAKGELIKDLNCPCRKVAVQQRRGKRRDQIKALNDKRKRAR